MVKERRKEVEARGSKKWKGERKRQAEIKKYRKFSEAVVGLNEKESKYRWFFLFFGSCPLMMSSRRGAESFLIMIIIVGPSFKSLGGKESFEIELPEFGLYFSFAAALPQFFFCRPVDKAGSKIFFSNFEPILKPFTMSQLENDVALNTGRASHLHRIRRPGHGLQIDQQRSLACDAGLERTPSIDSVENLFHLIGCE